MNQGSGALDGAFLDRLSPFWFRVDTSLCLEGAGPSLLKLFSDLKSGSPLPETFDLVRPDLGWDLDRWCAEAGRLFLFRGRARPVLLRGQLIPEPGMRSALFIGSPWMTDPEALQVLGLTLADFALSDPVVDLLHLFQAERMAHARGQEVLAQLQETAARERAILEGALEAILTIDDRGRVLAVNPATERLFGYASEDLLGQNVSRLMLPSDAEAHDGHLRRYLDTGEAHVIGTSREVLGRRKDGSILPLELSVAAFRIGDRRGFTGILRDISARKRAEASVRQHLQALEEQRANLEVVLDQLGVGVLLLDPEGCVRYLNKACPVPSGLARQDLLGLSWQDVLPLDEGSRVQLAQHMVSGAANPGRIPLRGQLGEGRPCHLEADLHPFPGDPSRRMLLLYDLTELQELRSQRTAPRFTGLAGEGPAMRRLHQAIEEVAAGNWTVLIEGETGSGKELVARSIHVASPRRNGPFVAVNCAGLTESLLTSQLFGHVRGAFTGAVASQVGLFEAANEGTLFLDEIGDIPPGTQRALLRVLQEREIVRVGEVKPRKVDVRILAATHRDLAQEVAEGRFRQDLLYRIRVARVLVPPLRARREDIPMLVSSFLGECRSAHGPSVSALSREAEAALEAYDWPGNVRELKSAVESAAIHCHSGILQVEDLPAEVRRVARPLQAESGPKDERTRIIEALKACGGHRGKAAASLGWSRATFYRHVESLGMALDPDAE